MTRDIEVLKKQVDKSGEGETVALLARVVAWETNVNDPAQIRRKIDAQDYLNAIVLNNNPSQRNGAMERAKKFLHGLAEQAAAREGF